MELFILAHTPVLIPRHGDPMIIFVLVGLGIAGAVALARLGGRE